MSGRKPSLTLSEIATISLIKSEYGIRTWKGLYNLLKSRFRYEFRLPVYKNFVLLMNNHAKLILVLLNALLQINLKQAGVIKILDSYLGLKVDYKPLMKTAEEFESKLKELISKVKKTSEQKQEKDTSYLG